ncbi:MAG TPA: GNAT family N-acetyltransferase, partial [Methylophaga sp.]|nr:GNAT family N-acetyltransferase [Methylophaga sp.]
MKSREMEQHDIAEVVAIEQAANQHPWSMKNFKDCLKAGHRAWVFINDQQELIGYTIVQQVVDEAHLLNICVKPSLQGQGIG